MGDALVALRPSQLRTKPCSVKTTSNGWTAIRNAILASLARYWRTSDQRIALSPTRD
ncbi:hypothetical protein [Bathymodiolus platifrons methanotrophic gill symbiont]|uniref:hypothetical protein n=1 Tax=Bathymodiolus platifrons methanotrophic gill symbiont TaxID=113268 RepID=UPI001C8E664D|nr:hypothetical protein [Bathymodiolus platifrons methanotrophic gill symbiont]